MKARKLIAVEIKGPQIIARFEGGKSIPLAGKGELMKEFVNSQWIETFNMQISAFRDRDTCGCFARWWKNEFYPQFKAAVPVQEVVGAEIVQPAEVQQTVVEETVKAVETAKEEKIEMKNTNELVEKIAAAAPAITAPVAPAPKQETFTHNGVEYQLIVVKGVEELLERFGDKTAQGIVKGDDTSLYMLVEIEKGKRRSVKKGIVLEQGSNPEFAVVKFGFKGYDLLPATEQEQMEFLAQKPVVREYIKFLMIESKKQPAPTPQVVEEVKTETATEEVAKETVMEKTKNVVKTVHEHTTGWFYVKALTPTGHFFRDYVWAGKYGMRRGWRAVRAQYSTTKAWACRTTLRREISCAVVGGACVGVAFIAAPIVVATPFVATPYVVRGAVAVYSPVKNAAVTSYKWTRRQVSDACAWVKGLFTKAPVAAPAVA